MTRSDFYVGYLPLPSGHKRFLRTVVASIVVLIVGVAVITARAQRSPGPGSWSDDAREFTGVLVTAPYPMLVTEGGTHLVVSSGKHGGQSATASFSGHRVKLRGTVIARDARSIIELGDGPDAIATIDARLAAPSATFGEVVEVVGEVIDPKCFLGAMMPGDGRAHKACATLCIEGGIPPMLYSVKPDGSKRFYLLASAEGGSAKDVVMPWIAEMVVARGRAARLGDLDILYIDLVRSTRN